jgi:hypothetical protein
VRERAIGVDVQPDREDCPPTHVDLSLIRDGDGRRVIASSPDGRVIGGFDVPLVAGLMPPPARRWAAGVRYDPFWRVGGVWIERDVSRIRIGVDAGQAPRGGLQAGVSVGWVW